LNRGTTTLRRNGLWKSVWVRAAVLFVAYLLAAEVGNALSIQSAYATFWPPAGLVLAALLLSEYRDWPVLLAVAVLGSLASDVLHDRVIVVSVGFAVARAVESFTGAVLMRVSTESKPRFETATEFFLFVVFGALVGPALGAALSATTQVLAGGQDPLWMIWGLMWIADMAGVVLVASPIILAVSRRREFRAMSASQKRGQVSRWAAGAALGVGTVCASWFIFGTATGTSGFKFLLLAGLLAVGGIGGPFIVATFSLLDAVAGIASIVIHTHAVPFASAANALAIVQAQGSLVVAAISATAISIALVERRILVAESLETASRLQAIVDNAPFGAHMYKLTDDDRLIFIGFNRKAEEMLKIDHNRLLGKTLEEAFPGNVGTETPEQYRRVAREGISWESEQFAYDAGSISGIFDILAFPFIPNHMVVFFRDITEKRKVELALEETEIRYRRVFEHMQETFAYCELLYGTDGRPCDWIYIDVNEAFARMSGGGAFAGKRILELAPNIREDAPGLFEGCCRVGESGKAEEFDVELWGRWVHLMLSSPEKDHFVVIGVDIGDRRRAEEAVLRERAVLAHAETIARMGSWRLDLTTHEFHWSDEMYRLLGLERGDEALDFVSATESAVHPDDRARIVKLNEEFMTDFIPRPAKYRIVRPDGEVRWVDTQAEPEHDEDNKVVAVVGFLQDITDQERAKAALMDSNERLEDLLKSITATMGRVVEARDPYTQGHEVGVAKLARLIAEEMGLPEGEVGWIEMTGLVHDIGKLSVPAEILTKPGTLSETEFLLIKEHSLAGSEILREIDFGWPIAETVLQHHERLDGSGYPRALAGDAITVAARVLAVADVVEAMASHRPYRPALGLDVAVREVKSHPEKFDSGVVAACVRLYETGRIDL
jgi:PAS domain S-box-containing protein